jgi:hypothetical protein
VWIGLRWQEDAGRSGLVYASWKSVQEGQIFLSSCQCVTTALLPTEAGWMSMCLSSRESPSLRKQEGKKCPDTLTLVGEAKAQQR